MKYSTLSKTLIGGSIAAVLMAGSFSGHAEKFTHSIPNWTGALLFANWPNRFLKMNSITKLLQSPFHQRA